MAASGLATRTVTIRTRPRDELSYRQIAMPMVKKKHFRDQPTGYLDQSPGRHSHYGNESEVVRELIRERQIREQETPEEIMAVRAALIEAEESVKQKGYSNRSVNEIWEEAKARHRAQDG